MLELSTALGAFVAGLVVHAAKETDWVEDSLHGFRVIFIAFFFLSIGLLMDTVFLLQNWFAVAVLVLVALLANHVINTLIIRSLGRSWSESIYAGAMLAQIGEFSFVLAAVGLQANVIGRFGYQLAISTIAISLLLSPAWMAFSKWGIARFGELPEPGPNGQV